MESQPAPKRVERVAPALTAGAAAPELARLQAIASGAVVPSEAGEIHSDPEGAPAAAAKAGSEFWQKKWVQDVLPFCTSLAFHLGLILIGWVTYEVVQQVVPKKQEQIIIPDATIIEGAEIGGIPNPGLGGDPFRAAAQDQIETNTAQGWAEKPSQTLAQSLLGGGTEVAAADSLIGAGSAGLGKGPSKGIGSAGEGGGPLAPFGVPGGGGGIGPKSPFMGVSGNARRVIYICDASGSMVSKFITLKAELRKSVTSLLPIQSFNIIFLRDQKAYAADERTLLVANQVNKEKAMKFVEDFVVGPDTFAVPALQMAFAQKPQLIYLLADGDFDDVSEVKNFLTRANAEKSVKINTILFRGRSDETELYKGVITNMQDIADMSGGTFRMVSEDEL